MARVTYWGIGVGTTVALFATVVATVVSSPFGLDGDRDENRPLSRHVVNKPPDQKQPDSSRKKHEERGPYPAIVKVSVGHSTDESLPVQDEDFVLGIEFGSEARAYPLNMFGAPERHVVNDTVGGEPVAVTWCGLCQSPLVFSRRVANRTLTLFVTGELDRENLVIRDVETGSEWVQLLGESVHGPLKGKQLNSLPAVWTDWKTWRTEHPETTVLTLSRATEKYRHTPLYSQSPSERNYFGSLQWGLAHGAQAMSWPFMQLAQQPIVNTSFADEPLLILFDTWSCTLTAFNRHQGDKTLTFTWQGDGLTDTSTGSVWDPITGQALRGPLAGKSLSRVPGTISKVRSWRIFHPATEIWTAGSATPLVL